MVLLGAFVLWERHTDHPILDVTFFKNPRFTAASIAVTLVFFAMFGSMFFISQYLQFVLGYSALKSGACLLPVAASLMVAAPLSAKLVARFGTKIVVAAGLGLVGLALLVFSRVTVTSGYGLVAVVLVIIGVGMGFAMAPATDSIMGSLPPAQGRRRLRGERHHPRDRRRARRRHPGQHHRRRLHQPDRGQPQLRVARRPSRRRRPRPVSDSIGGASIVARAAPGRGRRGRHRGGQRGVRRRASSTP